jgi:hypothetical protein
MEPPNHAAPAERAHSCERGGRGDSDALGEALIGDPGVGSEELEDRTVDLVYRLLWMIRHEMFDRGNARRIYGEIEIQRMIFDSAGLSRRIVMIRA